MASLLMQERVEAYAEHAERRLNSLLVHTMNDPAEASLAYHRSLMRSAQKGTSFEENNIERVLACGDAQHAVFFVASQMPANEYEPQRASVHVMNMVPPRRPNSVHIDDYRAIPELTAFLIIRKQTH